MTLEGAKEKSKHVLSDVGSIRKTLGLVSGQQNLHDVRAIASVMSARMPALVEKFKSRGGRGRA